MALTYGTTSYDSGGSAETELHIAPSGGDMTWPTSLASGDLVIVCMCWGSGDFSGQWGGQSTVIGGTWTRDEDNNSSNIGGGVYYATDIDGSSTETEFESIVSEFQSDEIAGIAIRVTGEHATPERILSTTAATGDSSSPDAPNLTGLTSGNTYGVLTFYATDGATTISSHPSGYGGSFSATEQTGSEGSITVASKDSDITGVTSINPGAATASASDQWVAWTMAIKTDAAAGGLSIPVAMNSYRHRHQSVV